ncbi:Hypothetical predicted protein [Mytilus galloprovincialis]|uniref:Fucolectin tachylectin-4 pentraxin-1 domain-containing protein n=2 Tax=Mytilus galloprovincialis TaxID=29158 RepID=A0A8B6BTP4_MYTGA|nr:Hypothetical predicted protein [Mytilus galloprovincialis]
MEQPLVLSAQINISEWLESKLDNNTSMLKEILTILRKDNTTRLKEVAYGKRSYQSSTYIHGHPSSSHLAVNGNIHTMIHTTTENSPYWEVDLGRIYRIKRVEIYNRRDCCGDRLHDLDITVGPSHNRMSLCTHYTGPGINGAHLIFDCHRTESGRYVNLRIKEGEAINLMEDKVYAIE